MILDDLAAAERVVPLHPAFARAFAFLRNPETAALAPGKIELDGRNLYAVVMAETGRGRDESPLEAHRDYIDIQCALAGEETIGWSPLSACRRERKPYDPAKDIVFYEEAPESWFAVPPGRFAVFFPADAHAPLAGRGPIRKVVVKIRLSR